LVKRFNGFALDTGGAPDAVGVVDASIRWGGVGVQAEIDHRGGRDEFAIAHRLQPLEFMQRAMDRVSERAFVPPQVGEYDDGGFQHAARLQHRIAQIEVLFSGFDLLEVRSAATRSLDRAGIRMIEVSIVTVSAERAASTRSRAFSIARS